MPDVPPASSGPVEPQPKVARSRGIRGGRSARCKRQAYQRYVFEISAAGNIYTSPEDVPVIHADGRTRPIYRLQKESLSSLRNPRLRKLKSSPLLRRHVQFRLQFHSRLARVRRVQFLHLQFHSLLVRFRSFVLAKLCRLSPKVHLRIYRHRPGVHSLRHRQNRRVDPRICIKRACADTAKAAEYSLCSSAEGFKRT